MKNKKILILLLLLVITIWGTIIYRFLKVINHPDTFAKIQTAIKSSPVELSVDTFSIIADYRDPFLGKRATPVTIINKVKPKVKPPPPPPVVIRWPAISYMGIIRNQNSDKELALVKIEQKEFIMKAGESIVGVVLSKIYKDSILVFYQQEKKIVIK